MLGRQNIFRQFAILSSRSYKNGAIGGCISPANTLQTQSQLSHQVRFKSSHVLEVGENRQIAYRQMPGQSQPTIVMVPGFHSYSHMNGMTAKSILRYEILNAPPTHTQIYSGVHWGDLPPHSLEVYRST